VSAAPQKGKRGDETITGGLRNKKKEEGTTAFAGGKREETEEGAALEKATTSYYPSSHGQNEENKKRERERVLLGRLVRQEKETRTTNARQSFRLWGRYKRGVALSSKEEGLTARWPRQQEGNRRPKKLLNEAIGQDP